MLNILSNPRVILPSNFIRSKQRSRCHEAARGVPSEWKAEYSLWQDYSAVQLKQILKFTKTYSDDSRIININGISSSSPIIIAIFCFELIKVSRSSIANAKYPRTASHVAVRIISTWQLGSLKYYYGAAESQQHMSLYIKS